MSLRCSGRRGCPLEPSIDKQPAVEDQMCKMAWWLAPAAAWIGLAGLADRAAAQNSAAEAQEANTVIITLGTRGGPLPTKDRAQSSNLLVVNGTLYLIDAGDGVTRRIVQAGYDFLKVGKVFITHPHSDHTNGLATLLASEWEYQRREPIDVYGRGVEALVKGAIDYLTPNAEIRWAEGRQEDFDGRYLSWPRRSAGRGLPGCQRQGD